MKQILSALKRTKYGAVAALFLLTAVAVALPAQEVKAVALLERSLELSSSVPSIPGTPTTAGGVAAPFGSAANGNQVTHTYTFQVGTTSVIQAIQIQYCDGPFGYLSFAPDSTGACGSVDGFSADAAPSAVVTIAGSLVGLGSPTDTETYTVDGTPTTANNVFVTNVATPISATAGDFIRVTFTATNTNFFVNPDATYVDFGAANKTFFGHIETYDDPAERNTSTLLDEGTVASSTANAVNINTRVQETLKFSVGTEADPAAPGAACDPLTGTAALLLGDANNALSATTAYNVTSYFRLSTNASSGVEVLYAGRTLTSTAGDTITAVGGTAAASATGTEQFGLTVDTANADNSMTQLTSDADFTNPANYAFDATSDTAPLPIATATGFVACDTGAVKYVANIANDTEAGLYSTKVAYIAVPSY